MLHRNLLLITALGLLSAETEAQSSCYCNFRFGDACNGFQLASSAEWRLGAVGRLSAGPATGTVPTIFMIGLRLPQPIPIGTTGCNLHVNPVVTFGTVTNGGFAALPLPIPRTTSLLGARFSTQAAGVASATAITSSNGYSIALTNGAPSTPPSSHPVLRNLRFGCNDNRVRGADPTLLGEFIAYHTRLTATDRALDPHGTTQTHTISGNRADIVVNIPQRGHLQLGRGTSFLPVWVPANGSPVPFPELVARTKGDGDATRPDRINRYSFARVLSQSDEQIVVHWRYIPDFSDPTPTGVVHELFTISRSGSVTRLVHESAETIEEAATTAKNQRQTLTLNATGLQVGTATRITRALPPSFSGTTPVRTNPVTAPRLAMSFDEGHNHRSRTTTESVSRSQATIEGRLANWHPGVSGTSLAFDGYTSGVRLPAASAPNITGSFTVSCWVSLGAYPFSTVPLAGQVSPHGNDAYVTNPYDNASVYTTSPPNYQRVPRTMNVGGVGYMLAVDGVGRVVLGANLNGTWRTLAASFANRVPLNRWVHLIGTYDATDGEFRIVMDGREIADTAVPRGASVVIDRGIDFIVGRNTEPQFPVASSPIHAEAFKKSVFGIEGLIDEVRVYDRALTAQELAQSLAAADANAKVLDPRRLPSFSGTQFGARHTTLRYHKGWNELFHDSGSDDIVVTFDQNTETKLAFWRGMAYGPSWLTAFDGTGPEIWNHDQSMEAADDDHDLAEHMADKETRHAHARIIEQTDARIVVHWRYVIVSPSYRLTPSANELAWNDEFYAIYPDGTVARQVRDWFCNRERLNANTHMHAFQGSYFLTPAGYYPMQLAHDRIATVLNRAGRQGILDVVRGTNPDQLLTDAAVLWTNTRSRYRLFRGIRDGAAINYETPVRTVWNRGTNTDPTDLNTYYSPFGSSNHFPVTQLPTAGREAIFTDRVTHSEGWASMEGSEIMLYGFSRTAAAALPVVNHWNFPATVSSSSTTTEGFTREENAFYFTGNVSTLTFTLQAQANTPVINPAIVVEGWTGPEHPTVRVGNTTVTGTRSGVHYNGGVRTLVVWLPLNTLNASIRVN